MTKRADPSDTTGEAGRCARLARALLDSSAYPESSPVEHVETHISHVFLTGAHAYKIKKPVDLGFLDFSTLAQRRRFCEEELRINRRLAPRVYLSVVPIAGTVDAPRVEGAGPAIEYAVKMRRFPQELVLDRLAEAGDLQHRHVDEIAGQLARFHRDAARAGTDTDFGAAQRVLATAEENFEQLAARVHGEAAASLARVHGWSRSEGARLAPAMDRRKHEGKVRECHGDLHLGNIALLDDDIVLFDALEFNASLRWTDTMNDVAFLAMDLHAHARPDLAARFVDSYLSHSGDYAGLEVLRYYQVYRALVRAKIAALRGSQNDTDPLQRRAWVRRCAALIALASSLTHAQRPALVLLHGVSGSGKTWAAQRMLEATGAVRIRSDVERKRLHGMDALAPSASATGAGLYAPDSTARTYARLADLARQILRAHYAVLVDATFLRAAQRAAFLQLAREEGVRARIASFVAPEDALRARVRARQAVRSDASEATLEVLEWQLRTREPLSTSEAAVSTPFTTELMSEAQIAAAARTLMEDAADQRDDFD